MTTHETSQAKGRDDVAVWLSTPNQMADEPDTDAAVVVDMLKGGALTLAAVVVVALLALLFI